MNSGKQIDEKGGTHSRQQKKANTGAQTEEHQAEAHAVTDEPTAKCGQEVGDRHREEAQLETFPTTLRIGMQKVTGELQPRAGEQSRKRGQPVAADR